MAASKIHLANTDKNYKLKKTDKLTTEGKPIYVNSLTGEEHSEISVTIEYPANSGKWINVPSLKNGRVYNPKGVLAMLKAGKLTPTSTHMSEQEAVEAAVYRSTTLQSNTGETLKPSNDINLLTSQSARITEQEVPGLIAEVNRAEDAFQNQETGFPEPRVTRADVPAYTSGSGANADILAAAEAALAADNANKAENNFQRQNSPLSAMDIENNRLQEMGRTMSSYGERTGGVNPLNPNTMLANGSSNGRGIDYSRDPIDPLRNLVDLSNIEALTVNGAPGSTYNVNKSENAFQGMDNNRTFAQKIMDSLSNPAIANIAGMSYTGDQARADKLVNDAENAFQNQDTIDPLVEYRQKEAELLAQSKALSEKNRNIVDQKENFKYAEGPSTRQSKPKPITGNAPAMDDSADIEAGMGTNYMMTDGPERRQSNKPVFNFKYKPHMTPEQKMKDNRSLKGLTPDYGEMPGFKKAKDGNYWSADENSEFWKTDAGYEKAVQTWGASGNPLPTYVKKPARKELDVQAIKNFFKPNR